MFRIVFNLVILLIQAFLLMRAVVVFFEAGWVAGLAFVLLASTFSLAKFRAPAKQSWLVGGDLPISNSSLRNRSEISTVVKDTCSLTQPCSNKGRAAA